MDTVHDMVRDCIRIGQNLEPRAETAWLDRKYRDFMKEKGIRKKLDADRELCRQIFGARDWGVAETQKLRYWRSGRHMPNDRGIVERLGEALGLDAADQAYLIKSWFDRCDRCFSGEDAQDPLYVSRQAQMQGLVGEYLLKCRAREMDYITRKRAAYNFRHYYYLDSLMCVSGGAERRMRADTHYQSVYYQSELSRTVRLLGEIPRITMIRHLILLLNPFVSRAQLDKKLEDFGYLPLTEAHSLVTGEWLDLLLIRLLAAYEAACQGREPEECRNWLEAALAEMDGLLAENGQGRMRFMRYKGMRLEDRGKG